MARPRLDIGTYGRISLAEVAPGKCVARARFRDFDGRTRKVEAWGRSRSAAERNLKAALADRAMPGEGDVKGDSKVNVLWDVFRARLVADGAAPKTLDNYDYAARAFMPALGEWTVREVTTQQLERVLTALTNRNGPGLARSARAVLSGMFRLAVQYNGVQVNPVRETRPVKSNTSPARALTVDELRAVLRGVQGSAYARRADLVDLTTFLAATGVRIGEALGLRWSDVDLEAGRVRIAGHVIRATGLGLQRVEGTKANEGRVLPLPSWAVATLLARQVNAETNIHDVVFPSSAGTLRDVDNVSKQWRRLRTEIGFPWVTTHVFRKTVATLLDDAGLSARLTADQLGHRSPSMTQDVYMGRGQVHSEVATVLDSVADRFESAG